MREFFFEIYVVEDGSEGKNRAHFFLWAHSEDEARELVPDYCPPGKKYTVASITWGGQSQDDAQTRLANMVMNVRPSGAVQLTPPLSIGFGEPDGA